MVDHRGPNTAQKFQSRKNVFVVELFGFISGLCSGGQRVGWLFFDSLKEEKVIEGRDGHHRNPTMMCPSQWSPVEKQD